MLAHCSDYPKNTYLFMTKNPKRFWQFLDEFPPKSILGATIESTWYYPFSYAPPAWSRQHHMKNIPLDTMVNIEPILDFDLDVMVKWIKEISPRFVSIGADSKRHDLPEPSPEKVEGLIKELGKFTEVRLKRSLGRLRELRCAMSLAGASPTL